MSELNFNFNDVKVEIFESKYLEPGNYVVKTTKVAKGVSSGKSSPFIEIFVEAEDGLTANHKYYLTSTPGASGKSALDITSSQLVILVAAANNLDINSEEGKTKAKSLIGQVKSIDELIGKVASLLVGKSFALKLNGKWVNPTDVTKKPYIIAEFAGGVFALPTSELANLKPFDPSKGIKGEPGSSVTANSASTGLPGANATANW